MARGRPKVRSLDAALASITRPGHRRHLTEPDIDPAHPPGALPYREDDDQFDQAAGEGKFVHGRGYPVRPA